MTRASIVLLTGLLAACAIPVRIDHPTTVSEVRVRRIALVPLSVEGTSAGPELGPDLARTVSQLVTGQILEALTLRTRYEVIPPEEVRRVVDPRAAGLAVTQPQKLGQMLRASFGVDAVLRGTVRRFRQRVGGPRGATRPAAVLLDLELISAEGESLWLGTYDEIQRPLSDDVRSFSRAFGRSFRWLTAAELSRYGAAQLVDRLPEAAD